MIISCPLAIKDNNDGTAVLKEDINLYQYIPFSEGNKLATLTKNASIKFLENLPTLDGATALYPVYASFVQAVYPSLEKYNSLSDGILRCTTTSQAYLNLINGVVDIIFCAVPSQNQIAMAAARGITLNLTPIGRDAFVFFVNENNPINDITIEQIRSIYSGSITDWEEIGGEKSEILAYQRPINSGSQTALELIMEGLPIMNPPVNWIQNGMASPIDEVAAYKNYGNAIGYSFLFFTTEMVNNNQIKILSIDDVIPSFETIQTDKYPFSGSFFAITRGNESENTIKFIEWILSDEGQYLIEKTGYVPINLN